MLHKTQGVVLNFIRYRETSIIVKIYTLEFGLKTYLVNSVRSRTAKSNKMALYQPLTFLDLVAYNREHSEINRIGEARVLFALHSLSTDMKKATISIFLSEVLIKTLKEEESNPELFEFLQSSLSYFDQAETGVENFHLQFLLRLPNFLGFGLSSHRDLLQEFPDLIVKDTAFWEVFDALLFSDFQDPISISLSQRREVLQLLLRFYQFHVAHFGELKSLEVLRALQ